MRSIFLTHSVLTNGKQIWQIATQLEADIKSVGAIEWQFFTKHCVPENFPLAKSSQGEKKSLKEFSY